MFPPGSVPAGTRHVGHGVLLRASDPGGAQSPFALLGAFMGTVEVSLAPREGPPLSFLGGNPLLWKSQSGSAAEGRHWAPRSSPFWLRQAHNSFLTRGPNVPNGKTASSLPGQPGASGGEMLFCSAVHAARQPPQPPDIPWCESHPRAPSPSRGDTGPAHQGAS